MSYIKKLVNYILCLGMVLCLFTVISTAAPAAEPNMLTRDEVSALKKRLVAVVNAMGKLAEEMQKKAGEAQLAEVEGKRDPIELQFRLNTYQVQTLDSDK